MATLRLVSGNARLLGAATVAGAYWGTLAAGGHEDRRPDREPHVTCGVAISLVAPMVDR